MISGKLKTTTLKFSHLFSAKAMLYSFFNLFIVSDLNLSLERQLFTAYSAQLVDKRSECNFCLQEWNNLNLALSRKVTKETEASSFPLHETWKKNSQVRISTPRKQRQGGEGGGDRERPPSVTNLICNTSLHRIGSRFFNCSRLKWIGKVFYIFEKKAKI